MAEKKTREPMQRRIAYAQLAVNHPILKEDRLTQRQYYSALNLNCKRLLRISKYGKAVLNYYKSFFHIERQSNCKKQLTTKLRVALLFDILHISGYNRSAITPAFIRSLRLDRSLCLILESLFMDLRASNPLWDELFANRYVQSEAEWIDVIRRNIAFSRKKPYKIMVTATMSAGKSTFINALVGKKIASTKNLACTGRLHYIYSKPSDDSLIGLWDRQVILDAQNNILNESEELQERISYESVYYKGKLNGKHCMILDTPGVNSAEYQKHGECTSTAIKDGAYDALVFLINYEHIGTDDEIAHLSFIKQNVDSSIPLVFCINKVDSKKRDDLTLEEKMQDIKSYLQQQGFPDATIFLVSSRAAFLYRMRDKLNNEDDIEDLELLTKKIKRSTNLVTLYSSIKPSYVESSVDCFEYQCGIGYIEDYLIKLMLKKERND